MLPKGALVALGIVVAGNAAALSVAALNRNGEPDATLRLTERELRLPVRGAEETGMSLSIDWNRRLQRANEEQPFPWFDQRKLESIGFDCRIPPGSPSAERY